MTARFITALFVLALVALLALAGCGYAPSAQTTVRHSTPSAPVVASQEGKDAAIVSEAAKIDEIAPQAKEHTDAQRAAVAAAPAADVKKILAEKDEEIKELRDLITSLQKQIADLAAQLKTAKDMIARILIIGGYALSALLVAAGVASLFLMAQLPFLGPKISYALMAAGASIFAMVQIYEFLRGHQWILWVLLGIASAFIFAAAILAYGNHFHDRAEKAKTPQTKA